MAKDEKKVRKIGGKLYETEKKTYPDSKLIRATDRDTGSYKQTFTSPKGNKVVDRSDIKKGKIGDKNYVSVKTKDNTGSKLQHTTIFHDKTTQGKSFSKFSGQYNDGPKTSRKTQGRRIIKKMPKSKSE